MCTASKEVVQDNQRFEPTKKISHAFGRRIDMIISDGKVEFLGGEWKKEGASMALGLSQQTKNVRIIKDLLTKLLQYPLSPQIKDSLYCLGIDFTSYIL